MTKISLEQEFKKIITEYRETAFEAVEAALDEVSLDMQKKLEAASPVGVGFPHFKDSWDRKLQYVNVRYIGNTKKVPRGAGSSAADGIPLSNILEHSNTRGRPFIKRTWNSNKNEIYRKFIRILGGKI